MQNEYTQGLIEDKRRLKAEIRKLHALIREKNEIINTKDARISSLQNELTMKEAQNDLIQALQRLEFEFSNEAIREAAQEAAKIAVRAMSQQ
jgi:hypothetical protein